MRIANSYREWAHSYRPPNSLRGAEYSLQASSVELLYRCCVVAQKRGLASAGARIQQSLGGSDTRKLFGAVSLDRFRDTSRALLEHINSTVQGANVKTLPLAKCCSVLEAEEKPIGEALL